MIHEAYVSFETAKLLKERGFDYDETHMFYSSFDSDRIFPITEIGLVKDEDVYYAPTHQMACAWLREVHKIHIEISPVSGKGYGAILCDVGDFDDFNYIGETDYFFHAEEAAEAALKYSLENLI